MFSNGQRKCMEISFIIWKIIQVRFRDENAFECTRTRTRTHARTHTHMFVYAATLIYEQSLSSWVITNKTQICNYLTVASVDWNLNKVLFHYCSDNTPSLTRYNSNQNLMLKPFFWKHSIGWFLFSIQSTGCCISFILTSISLPIFHYFMWLVRLDFSDRKKIEQKMKTVQ